MIPKTISELEQMILDIYKKGYSVEHIQIIKQLEEKHSISQNQVGKVSEE